MSVSLAKIITSSSKSSSLERKSKGYLHFSEICIPVYDSQFANSSQRPKDGLVVVETSCNLPRRIGLLAAVPVDGLMKLYRGRDAQRDLASSNLLSPAVSSMFGVPEGDVTDVEFSLRSADEAGADSNQQKAFTQWRQRERACITESSVWSWHRPLGIFNQNFPDTLIFRSGNDTSVERDIKIWKCRNLLLHKSNLNKYKMVT